MSNGAITEFAGRYPDAIRQPVHDELHGLRIADPYRWLEDAASPRTEQWLAAQDALWRQHCAGLPHRRAFLDSVAELGGAGMVSTPRRRGGRRFFLRQRPGEAHPVLLVADDAGERVLLDPATIDPSGLTTLDAWQPDGGGTLLAYQTSSAGSENAALRVLDVASGALVDGPIHGCRYSPVAWLPDATGCYYVRSTSERPTDRRVFLHRIGEPADTDEVVFDAQRPGAAYGIDLSADGRHLLLAASRPGQGGTDLWLADTRHPRRRRVVHCGLDARSAGTVGRDGRLYLLTDLHASTRRLCVTEPARPEPRHWRDLLPADPTAVLTGFTVLDAGELAKPVLLASYRRHAVDEISVHHLDTGTRLGTVPLPGPGSVGQLGTDPDAPHTAWFSYQDHVTPPAVYRYDARTGHTELTASAPGSATPPGVLRHQLLATSADGTPVRATVYALPSASAAPRPTILYGYGGFGVPLTPTYSSHILAWVRAGGVFVTANLRGGGEGGTDWHRAGMLAGKQNVIDDVFAVAEALIAEGWASTGTLGLTGESNGGLVMAAALTQRPDLFAAAVCSAPVLDMVRYERFGLGTSWRAEYGSVADPDALAVLLGYSPYHRVRPGIGYPAVLFTAFAGDTRVDPLHARKMCAALQHASSSGRPVLLRYEHGVGHGARSAHRANRLSADILAFLAAHTGLAQEPA